MTQDLYYPFLVSHLSFDILTYIFLLVKTVMSCLGQERRINDWMGDNETNRRVSLYRKKNIGCTKGPGNEVLSVLFAE